MSFDFTHRCKNCGMKYGDHEIDNLKKYNDGRCGCGGTVRPIAAQPTKDEAK